MHYTITLIATGKNDKDQIDELFEIIDLLKAEYFTKILISACIISKDTPIRDIFDLYQGQDAKIKHYNNDCYHIDK